MHTFRLVIAAFVAVAMLSLGAAACTTEQQSEVGGFIGGAIELVLLSIWLPIVSPCPPPGGGPCVDMG